MVPKYSQVPIFPPDSTALKNKNPGVAHAIIDRDGTILSYQYDPNNSGRLIPVNTTGIGIFDCMLVDESNTLLGLINHTVSTGRQTEHIHWFIWNGKSYLRHATIMKKKDSNFEALLTIKPYP